MLEKALQSLFPASALASPRQCSHLAACNETHPRWVSLQGSQVVLQSDAAAIVQHRFHTSKVSFHQLLLLACCLLLQGFHHCLEVLQQRTCMKGAAGIRITYSHSSCEQREPVTLRVLGIHSRGEGRCEMLMQISALQIEQ